MNKRWRGRGDVFMLDYDKAVQFGRKSGILYHQGDDVEYASVVPEEEAAFVAVN